MEGRFFVGLTSITSAKPELGLEMSLCKSAAAANVVEPRRHDSPPILSLPPSNLDQCSAAAAEPFCILTNWNLPDPHIRLICNYFFPSLRLDRFLRFHGVARNSRRELIQSIATDDALRGRQTSQFQQLMRPQLATHDLMRFTCARRSRRPAACYIISPRCTLIMRRT